jgi:transcriptional regulator with XRE-family HTH domain
MSSLGKQLRTVRERLGLTPQDVEAASTKLAARHSKPAFILSLSHVWEYEDKSFVPTVHHVYSLAVIYRISVDTILSWYGIDVSNALNDSLIASPAKSHLVETPSPPQVTIPFRMDPGFDCRRTTDIARMIQMWGVLPLSYLYSLATQNGFRYGFVGYKDFTMYPILPPGSFVQIDPRKTSVATVDQKSGYERPVYSEYERPIYFVRTPEGFACSWCSLQAGHLVLRQHPFSRGPVRRFNPQEAEVIGQVVGVAMRLRGL